MRKSLQWMDFTKCGIGGPLVDVINCADFSSISPGVSLLWGLKFAYFHRN